MNEIYVTESYTEASFHNCVPSAIKIFIVSQQLLTGSDYSLLGHNAIFSEELVASIVYQIIRRHNPEDRNPDPYEY
jgi:hypothetical protein